MNKDSNISTLEVNFSKIIDYVFHDISKAEEHQMENYFDSHEDLAAAVEDLLDFCLEHNFNKFMVTHFERMRTSEALNVILENIENQLDTIQTLQHFAKESAVVEENEIEIFATVETNIENTYAPIKAFGKKYRNVARALFTFLLLLNLPSWQTIDGDYSNSNLLKASQKEKVQQMMTLSEYEIQYMRFDMLDDRPITDFMTTVAIPSNFEMRYVTAD